MTITFAWQLPLMANMSSVLVAWRGYTEPGRILTSTCGSCRIASSRSQRAMHNLEFTQLVSGINC